MQITRATGYFYFVYRMPCNRDSSEQHPSARAGIGQNSGPSSRAQPGRLGAAKRWPWAAFSLCRWGIVQVRDLCLETSSLRVAGKFAFRQAGYTLTSSARGWAPCAGRVTSTCQMWSGVVSGSAYRLGSQGLLISVSSEASHQRKIQASPPSLAARLPGEGDEWGRGKLRMAGEGAAVSEMLQGCSKL